MSDASQRIVPEQVRQLRKNGAQVADIRDPQSFAVGHISGSRHTDNHSVVDFIVAADLDASLAVVCYYNNSSQNAAAYFIQQGFSGVYSLDDGFELWRSIYPADTSSGEAEQATPLPRQKNRNFSRLSPFTPPRTNYSSPQAIQNRGEPAHRLPGHRLRPLGALAEGEAPCSDGVWGILAGLAGGPPVPA